MFEVLDSYRQWGHCALCSVSHRCQREKQKICLLSLAHLADRILRSQLLKWVLLAGLCPTHSALGMHKSIYNFRWTYLAKISLYQIKSSSKNTNGAIF